VHAQKQLMSELPATILTTLFDSATPISYKTRLFRQSSTFSMLFVHFSPRNLLYFYFRSAWPNFLKSGTRVGTRVYGAPIKRCLLLRPQMLKVKS